jgi:hypothetical protein
VDDDMGLGKKEVVTITGDIDGRAGAEIITFAYAGRWLGD